MRNKNNFRRIIAAEFGERLQGFRQVAVSVDGVRFAVAVHFRHQQVGASAALPAPLTPVLESAAMVPAATAFGFDEGQERQLHRGGVAAGTGDDFCGGDFFPRASVSP